MPSLLPFSMKVPKGWQGPVSFVIEGPPEGPDEMSPRPRLILTQAKEAMPSAVSIKDEAHTSDDGAELWDFVLRSTAAEGQKTYRRMTFRMLGGKGYTLVGDFTKKTLKMQGSEMLRMMGSLQQLPE